MPDEMRRVGRSHCVATIIEAAPAILATNLIPFDPAKVKVRREPGDLIQVEHFIGAPAGSAAYESLYRPTGLKADLDLRHHHGSGWVGTAARM
jgi:hypothetical protein